MLTQALYKKKNKDLAIHQVKLDFINKEASLKKEKKKLFNELKSILCDNFDETTPFGNYFKDKNQKGNFILIYVSKDSKWFKKSL